MQPKTPKGVELSGAKSERAEGRNFIITRITNPSELGDWIARLDAFLQFNEKEILTHTGTVTAEIAKNFAETEFDKFHAIQAKNYESDFDKLLGQVKEAEKGYNMG